MSNELVPGFDDEKISGVTVTLKVVDQLSDTLIVIPNGELNTENTIKFEKRIKMVRHTGFKRLLFDFTGLHYLSSVAISFFVQLDNSLKEEGGALILVNMQSRVKEAFELLGFINFLHLEDTINEAITTITSESGSLNTAGFPLNITCPVCSRKRTIGEAGTYSCEDCGTSFEIDNKGTMSPA